MALKIEPVTPNFVAVISGIDLTKRLSQEQVDEIERTIWHYGVLVFHDQPVSKEEQVRFAEYFGPLDTGLQTKIMVNMQDRLKNMAISDISNVDTSGNVAGRDTKQTM